MRYVRVDEIYHLLTILTKPNPSPRHWEAERQMTRRVGNMENTRRAENIDINLNFSRRAENMEIIQKFSRRVRNMEINPKFSTSAFPRLSKLWQWKVSTLKRIRSCKVKVSNWISSFSITSCLLFLELQSISFSSPTNQNKNHKRFLLTF